MNNKTLCKTFFLHFTRNSNLICVSLCTVGWPLVSVHVTGTDTVVRGSRIQLTCKAIGSTKTTRGGRPRSVLWVKNGRQLNSEVEFLFYTVLHKTWASIFDCNCGRFLTTREGAWYNFKDIHLSVCLSVCMYVCMYVGQTISFAIHDVRSLFSHILYISMQYGSSSYMKVIGSMSRSREQKRAYSCIDQRRPAIFIGTRQMAPQTTSR